MGTFTIRLENLRFSGRIGVFEQERVVGNDFRVDVCVEVSDLDFVDEDLETSLSYTDVYELVRTAMRGEWQLLETVTRHIARQIISQWTSVERVSVKIAKLCVPVSGMQGEASVEYATSRDCLVTSRHWQ